MRMSPGCGFRRCTLNDHARASVSHGESGFVRFVGHDRTLRGLRASSTVHIAARNGRLIVCDMFGHRVVEVDPATGRVGRVLLDTINGAPIDGPNDLVMDAKGGLYITDPQFTPEAKKSQPGKQVYYLAADGTARVVIGPGEYAMPNGVELSPDGKTLYVNNTWLQPGDNFIWASASIDWDASVATRRTPRAAR